MKYSQVDGNKLFAHLICWQFWNAYNFAFVPFVSEILEI